MLITYPNRAPEDVVHHCKLLGLSPDVAQGWWEEYCARDARDFHRAVAAQHLVSIENYHAQHRPIDGIGQNTFRIAKELANYLWRHWGEQSLHEDFRKELIRKHPEFFFAPKVQPLSRIIHPGLPHLPPPLPPSAAPSPAPQVPPPPSPISGSPAANSP